MADKGKKGTKKTRLLPEEIILVIEHLINRDLEAQITKDEALKLAHEIAKVHPEKKHRDWKTIKDALYYYRCSARKKSLKPGSFLAAAEKQGAQLEKRLKTAIGVLKKAANEEIFGLLLQSRKLELENSQLKKENARLKKMK